MPRGTLALPGGARVPVVAAQWHHAYGVVTRGRVQLGCATAPRAGPRPRRRFLAARHRRTRAAHPGRRTATVRILTPTPGGTT
ncbi:hypothetical protein V2I01_39805 [Micromonospora sp. BRA006-A]|nr:hypothetical protein [Micromonospora sp. BRA006-A]